MIGESINHLWQSTIFVLLTAMVATALQKNRAHTRYLLWLAASLKFLLPFSLLIGLGTRLDWSPVDDSFAAHIATPTVSYAVEQIAQPFPTAFPSSSSSSGTESQSIAHWIPVLLFGVWACGFGTIGLLRLQSWRRIRVAVRSSVPLQIPNLGIQTKVQIRSCPGLLEPGVVGLWKPILLLPSGIVHALELRQLQAVLAHELCHARRRDNLTSAFHMIVEGVFWFHPLVWWIGSKLVDERERACDEEVLRLGNEPQVYAEGILNVCRLYRESPLVCMPGVTGSNLRKRVEDIMTNRVADKLSISRMALIIAAGVAAVASPVAIGVLQATASRMEFQLPTQPVTAFLTEPLTTISLTTPKTEPRRPVAALTRSQAKPLEFEAASVRLQSGGAPNPAAIFGCRAVDGVIAPDRAPVAANSIPEGRCVGEIAVQQLIALAYDIPPRYVSGGSEWMRQPFQLIQVNAKAPDPSKVTVEQLRQMMRSLLAERFKLEVHREKQQAQEYLLRVARNGVKFKATTGPEEPPHIVPSALGQGAITIRGKSDMAGFVRFLTSIVGFPVIDKTEISGLHEYSLSLNIVPGQRGGGVGVRGAGGGTGGISVTEFDPPISVALQEQLGLRLDREDISVEVIVIDRADKPSEN